MTSETNRQRQNLLSKSIFPQTFRYLVKQHKTAFLVSLSRKPRSGSDARVRAEVFPWKPTIVISFADAAFLVSLSEPWSVVRALGRVPGNIVEPLLHSVVLSEQSIRFWSAFKITSFRLTLTAFHCYKGRLHQIRMDICIGFQAFPGIISQLFHLV